MTRDACNGDSFTKYGRNGNLKFVGTGDVGAFDRFDKNRVDVRVKVINNSERPTNFSDSSGAKGIISSVCKFHMRVFY